MNFLPRQPYDSSNVESSTELFSQVEGSKSESKPTVFPSQSSVPVRTEMPHLTLNLSPTTLRWQSYLRPLWLMSLGLHLLVLKIPLPVQHPPPQSLKAVKITKLASVPQAKSKGSLKHRVATQPKPIPRSIPALAIQAPSPVVKASPAPFTPRPTVTPISVPTPKTEKQTLPEGDAEKALRDFPQYPGAITGCEEYCAQTQASLEDVAAYFAKTLPNHQWNIESISNQDLNRKVYRVQKGGLTKFLSILMAQVSGTIYVLADQELKLDDLKQIEESVAMIGSIVAGIEGNEAVDASSTAQPKRFERGADIVSQNLLEGVKPDEVWKMHLESALTKDGFEVVPSTNGYGGGPVYVVKRLSYTGYLNLVPSQGNSGTVIVLWKVPPI